MTEKNFKRWRLAARFIGVLTLIGGGILLYLGYADFIGSLINEVEPRMLACSISGIVVIAFAVVLLILGFASRAQIYITDESLTSEEKVTHRVEYYSDSDALLEADAPIICDSCGTSNDHDSKFCKSCGKKL